MKCPNCGSELLGSLATGVCPKCGYDNKTGTIKERVRATKEPSHIANHVAETCESNPNPIAKLLTIIAIITLVGCVLIGIYNLYEYEEAIYSVWIAAGIVSFAFIRGFSEVIQLLQDIKDMK